MKRINLYFDFEFTSLSPDAQPVSLGIVSDEIIPDLVKFKDLDKSKMTDSTIEKINDDKIEILNVSSVEFDDKDWVTLCNGIEEILIVPKKDIEIKSKSFYAEFSDFDINRCDDWVKENVVGKLKYIKDTLHIYKDDNNGNVSCVGKTEHIKDWVKDYIAQFSDYEIQFVCDCGTYDWYWMMQLLATWDEIIIYPYKDQVDIEKAFFVDESISYDEYKRLRGILEKANKWSDAILDISIKLSGFTPESYKINIGKSGLPKLPPNISPVPFDLNDLIAIKKGISPKEAFDLDRELMGLGFTDSEVEESMDKIGGVSKNISDNKHNSLWDAKVIKAIYNKLV